MSSKVRSTPAITLKFERLAYKVCNGARFDYDELPSRANEMVAWLQNEWCEGSKQGLTDDGAEERAIAAFGDLSPAIKRLRAPWYRRLLLHDRYRPHRYLVFLAAYYLVFWVTTSAQHLRLLADSSSVIEPDPDIAASDIVQGAFQYLNTTFLLPIDLPLWFVGGIGSLFGGLAAAGSVLVVRWQPSVRLARFAQPLILRSAFSIMALYAIGVLTIMPWSSALKNLQFIRANPDINYPLFVISVATAVSVVVGWAGAICLISELIDFPAWGCGQAAKTKAGIPAGVGYVRPEAICFWTLLFLGAATLVVHHENTRLLRFSRGIADANRIVVAEGYSLGVEEGPGSKDLPKLIQEVTTASRDTATHRNPWRFRYAVDFFNATNYLGTIYSDGQWFWIYEAKSGRAYHYFYDYWYTRCHGQYRFNDGSEAAETFRAAHEAFLEDKAKASK